MWTVGGVSQIQSMEGKDQVDIAGQQDVGFC